MTSFEQWWAQWGDSIAKPALEHVARAAWNAAVAEATKPPPCRHTERGGRVDGEKIEWWCQQCGKPMPSGYVSIYGWLGIPK